MTTKMHMCICVIVLFIVGTEGRGRLPLSNVAYQTILKRLRGEYNKPVAERTREEKNALHMLWRNPTSFTIENNKLMFNGKIVARNEDVDRCVYRCFKQTNGAGARKIRHYLAETCSGISEARIYRSLHKAASYAKVRGKFSNRPIWRRPIKAREIQERHQVDLVDLHPQEVDYNGKKYRYILTVIDVFSRFLWTRPLPTKKSSKIAKALAEIYGEHGPPKILQRDRGKDFEGPVVKLMKKLNVKIIRSHPYHPQSQGKVERSHRTLRRKIFFDLFKVSGSNWVENLQCNTQIINSEAKEEFNYKSPFQIYFGRSNNLLKNHLDGENPDDITSRTIAEENARVKMDITEKVPPAFYLNHYITSFMASLLAKFGLRVRFNPSGDGNCQFHALVDQLATLGVHRSSQGLRAELISDIELNPYLVDGSPIQPFVGSVQAYTQMMSLPGAYGDHVTLQRTAQLFNLQIIVVSSLGATATRLISPSGSYDESLPTLFLGHLAEGQGEHYLSLTPYDESYRCLLESFRDYTPLHEPENRHRTSVEQEGSGRRQRWNGIGQNRDECVENVDESRENSKQCENDGRPDEEISGQHRNDCEKCVDDSEEGENKYEESGNKYEESGDESGQNSDQSGQGGEVSGKGEDSIELNKCVETSV